MSDYIEKSKGLRLNDLDSCIVGLCKDNYLVYSYTKLIQYFCKINKLELIESIEEIEFNILSLEGSHTFKILYDWK